MLNKNSKISILFIATYATTINYKKNIYIYIHTYTIVLATYVL